jgi:hypothetical protein
MANEPNPLPSSGEIVERPFLRVTWQRGIPTKPEVGVNGCRVDDVLQVVQEKLQAYQAGPLSCEENDEALEAIRTALGALDARRRRRIEQGVLNTMTAHETERTEDVDHDFSATGA